MIISWRLVKKKHIKNAFAGEGARLFGGRWNHRGASLVYVSETLSLAVLELFVNLGREDIRFPLVSIPVEIPETITVKEINYRDLPHDWREQPPSVSTKNIGTEWAEKMSSVVLRVPSAIVPVEFNLLINPLHPDFGKIKIGKPQPFTFDSRMWKF